MANERFPLRKYLRQLDRMEHEFGMWVANYDREYEGAMLPGDRAALSRRAELLDELRQRLHELFHELEQLPRLS